VQLLEHPSSSFQFPSSHPSEYPALVSYFAFPQTAQLVFAALHIASVSSKQFAEHPSRSDLFESSQVSGPETVPFPQIAQLVFAALQTALFSSLQVLEHPSPGFKFESSHSSGPDTVPFPQIAQSPGPTGHTALFSF